MHIECVTLHHIEMNLKTPFTTSLSTTTKREFIIIEAREKSGITGWGECSAFTSPWYTEETIRTAWHMLTEFLIPLVLQDAFNHPDELQNRFSAVKRNNMAKAALEEAIWDIYSKLENKPLSSTLGGTKQKIEVGVAVGIETDEQKLLNTIEQYASEGYKRIKVKMKPGLEDEILAPIRKHFPTLPLMVDANGTYTLRDIEQLKRLDDYGLLMIEQPLANHDFIGHAKLQAQLNTPICLDESINSYEDAQLAIQLKSCKIIAIKIAKVGGLANAKKIHDLCQAHEIPVWCGGMLDSGIGRAHNIAISSLDNFLFPGDVSASARYWQKDIIIPEVTVQNGLIHIPNQPGIGYEIDRECLQAKTVALTTIQ